MGVYWRALFWLFVHLCVFSSATFWFLCCHFPWKLRLRKVTTLILNHIISFTRDHIAYYHEHIRNHVCQICLKDFPDKMRLDRHVGFFHADDAANDENQPSKDRHVCSHCSKKFWQGTHLRDHVDFVHLGLKKYVCEKCQRAFETKQRLKVWSLSSVAVSCQLLTKDLNQVSSVSLLVTSPMALANQELFELTWHPSFTWAILSPFTRNQGVAE